MSPLSLGESTPARIISRADVRQLIDLAQCIDAVEDAFRRHALGASIPPAVLGVHVDGGGFHVKTAGMLGDRGHARSLFAAKINANFPANPSTNGLPTIQGVIALFDATDGRVLALLDSSEITSVRTAAATAVAAKYLARSSASVVTVCGCGEQSKSQLRALACVRPVRRVMAYDFVADRASSFAREMAAELRLDIVAVPELGNATATSDIWITCTTAHHWFLGRQHVAAGAFVAAVGADNPEKQEIEPELLAENVVVADVLEQCAAIGDLHHALDARVMQRHDVRAELADIVTGRIVGRQSDDEIVVFDSTGTALQDVAVAALVYDRALAAGCGLTIDLGGISPTAMKATLGVPS
jgi:ornithine cyclodeaminase/alanine dehydrogenase-like protein (mu-crystallin family)